MGRKLEEGDLQNDAATVHREAESTFGSDIETNFWFSSIDALKLTEISSFWTRAFCSMIAGGLQDKNFQVWVLKKCRTWKINWKQVWKMSERKRWERVLHCKIPQLGRSRRRTVERSSTATASDSKDCSCSCNGAFLNSDSTVALANGGDEMPAMVAAAAEKLGLKLENRMSLLRCSEVLSCSSTSRITGRLAGQSLGLRGFFSKFTHIPFIK